MTTPPTFPIKFFKGRGTGSNRQPRFISASRDPTDRQWDDPSEDFTDPATLVTSISAHDAKSIISRNDSPDIGFDQSINPYLGCEHGCVYCYARPTHAYLGLSPGQDFETKIFAKKNAAAILRSELSRKTYSPSVIALGANTDPYQPAERKLGITRSILEVLQEFNAPVSITTKSALVVRDLDILSTMAVKNLVRVNISIATLDPNIARILDPRAPSPKRRLSAIEVLAAHGVPVAIFTSPIIPAITDVDLEKILFASSEAGAKYASYVMLRLPLEVRDLFVEWLEFHFPLRAAHVMSLISQSHDGKDYNSKFGQRMSGKGVHADLVAQRFAIAARKYGLNKVKLTLDSSQFRVPADPNRTTQRELF